VAKTSSRLSALKVASLERPGYYADGANLYFRIAPGKTPDEGPQSGGARGWIFRFARQHRTRDMGLGPYPQISLATARKLASKCRELVNQGVDPIEHRRAEIAAQRVAAAKALTFDECAREFLKDHEAGWRNAKHRAQWGSTLKRYASPVFGKLPVSQIDGALVLRAVKAIWYTKPETASRVRGRVESVLDWARVHGYRTGENPARWRGNLDHLLPARTKVRRVVHHAALPYGEIGTFMTALRERNDGAARALEFTILTAMRTTEALRATWKEVDLQKTTWTVPAERMKGDKEHRVPLTAAVLKILGDEPGDGFLFPGARVGRPLSQMAFLMLLRRMGYGHITVHGFRSTFRDWAAERTSYPNEVVEMALAHAIPSAVEAAYRRGDLFDKRRRLMDAWAEFCRKAAVGPSIVSLRGKTSTLRAPAARPDG
jgi:integrase